MCHFWTTFWTPFLLRNARLLDFSAFVTWKVHIPSKTGLVKGLFVVPEEETGRNGQKDEK